MSTAAPPSTPGPKAPCTGAKAPTGWRRARCPRWRRRRHFAPTCSSPLPGHAPSPSPWCARFPELDLSRVGVYGWSFGGYLSALAVLRRPDVFRAAVAGAPVVDWRDYDTHYTERYLDLPQANPRGYEESSLLTYAPRLSRP